MSSSVAAEKAEKEIAQSRVERLGSIGDCWRVGEGGVGVFFSWRFLAWRKGLQFSFEGTVALPAVPICF
ncbi:MAG: hypothetical protein ACI8PG_002658, partial [Planctomycetota bacterium]